MPQPTPTPAGRPDLPDADRADAPSSEGARPDARANRRVAGATAFAALVVGFVAARLLRGGLLAAGVLAIVLGLGTLLWTWDGLKEKEDLGQGILVSVLVALALLLVQRDAEDRQHDLDAERDEVEASQSLRLTLGLADELAGIDLAGRDLRGFVLSEKNLQGATLDGARFDEAVLIGADLRGASLFWRRADRSTSSSEQAEREVLGPPASFTSAVLDDAHLDGLDLRKVSLEDASLNHSFLIDADLAGANLKSADLARADLTGADLSDAVLESADLRDTRLCRIVLSPQTVLTGVQVNKHTRWPEGFDRRTIEARPDETPLKSRRGDEIQTAAPTRC
jgi:hypothetical protein